MYDRNSMKPYIHEKQLYIPDWCFEDTPVDSATKVGDYYVCNEDELSYAKYRDMRKMSYFACRWYPHLVQNGVATIASSLIKTTMLELRESLKEEWTGTQNFVRTCGSSPKDIVELAVFSTPKRAADALMSSQRTLNIMQNYSHDGSTHLFVRDAVTIENECRCFIHKRKLRAVSVYNYIWEHQRKLFETSIVDFCEHYSELLPYNSCVMELGLNDGEFPFVIEFNSYGIDGFAGASLFDWHREFPILYYSETPEFRYPSGNDAIG